MCGVHSFGYADLACSVPPAQRSLFIDMNEYHTYRWNLRKQCLLQVLDNEKEEIERMRERSESQQQQEQQQKQGFLGSVVCKELMKRKARKEEFICGNVQSRVAR